MKLLNYSMETVASDPLTHKRNYDPLPLLEIDTDYLESETNLQDVSVSEDEDSVERLLTNYKVGIDVKDVLQSNVESGMPATDTQLHLSEITLESIGIDTSGLFTATNMSRMGTTNVAVENVTDKLFTLISDTGDLLRKISVKSKLSLLSLSDKATRIKHSTALSLGAVNTSDKTLAKDIIKAIKSSWLANKFNIKGETNYATIKTILESHLILLEYGLYIIPKIDIIMKAMDAHIKTNTKDIYGVITSNTHSMLNFNGVKFTNNLNGLTSSFTASIPNLYNHSGYEFVFKENPSTKVFSLSIITIGNTVAAQRTAMDLTKHQVEDLLHLISKITATFNNYSHLATTVSDIQLMNNKILFDIDQLLRSKNTLKKRSEELYNLLSFANSLRRVTVRLTNQVINESVIVTNNALKYIDIVGRL